MTARIYVGTYAKYNAGSIAGKWLDLEDYTDKDAFLDACAELHKDEADPEFMFQDFEGFPRSFYAESSIDSGIWEWLELSDDDRALLEVYQDNVDQTGTIEQAREAYHGTYNSEADFAAELLDECGTLESIPENLRNYFDYEAYARDLRLNGDCTFARVNGDVWVFWIN